MRNHDQKIKDMAESVLPSKRRQSAKQHRRAIHKRSRRQVNDELRQIQRVNKDELAAACIGLAVDVDSELAYMIQRRREQDKVSPIMRWAERRVDTHPMLRQATPAEQLTYFRRIMPDNLVGRHAVDHIEDALVGRATVGRRRASAAEDRADRRAQEYQAAVRTIVEAGLHGELNTGIKQQRRREQARYMLDRRAGRSEQAANRHLLTGPRLLLGTHDVESFADDTRRSMTVPGIVDSVLPGPQSRRGAR